MPHRIVQNEELSTTQLVPDLLTGTDIGTWQAEYLLREVEFERIKNGKPITFNWANSIGLASVGFGLSIFAKAYADFDQVSNGEWVALCLGVGFAIFLYIVGLLMPDGRKQVMKKIEKHFEEAPTKRQIF